MRWSAAADKRHEPRQEILQTIATPDLPEVFGMGCEVFTERKIGEMHKVMIDQHQDVEGSCLAVAWLSKHSSCFHQHVLVESLDTSRSDWAIACLDLHR